MWPTRSDRSDRSDRSEPSSEAEPEPDLLGLGHSSGRSSPGIEAPDSSEHHEHHGHHGPAAAYLSLRIVTLDHYMADPIPGLDPIFASDRHYTVRKVPVLRAFGPTPAGQKACLHLHGVFPYLYVPLPAAQTATSSQSSGYAYRLAHSLDHALNLSMGLTASQQQHIYKVQQVSGVPFYGYHPRAHTFLKLFFYHPGLIKRAGDLLQNGAVMGLKIQPHESHVPYTLQFMMDYNLQGMNFIHLAHAKFRRSASSGGVLSSEPPLTCAAPHAWTPASQRHFRMDDLPPELLLPGEVIRMSTSELELDGVAADILNSNEAVDHRAQSLNPGLAAIWADERLRRQCLDLPEDLTPPSSPPREIGPFPVTDSQAFWQDRFRAQIAQAKLAHPEAWTDTNASSDPDATCNFQPSGSPGPTGKTQVYAQETPDDLQLPSATFVDDHVPSLSRSMVERIRHPSNVSDDLFEGDRLDMNDTIVDEEVVRSQSQPHTTFDQDEQDLVDLLNDLGRRKEAAPDLSEAEAKESLEMSQILCWGDDDEQDDAILANISTQPAATKANPSPRSPSDLWDQKEDSFWDNLDIDQYLKPSQ
ncbi:hypothetical protein TCAL_14741 [Tigriopus californicus]|uniref:Uncharacterized protein n=1 Tax=Tigriopus californicus TaxID=6832 RepID=A0A553PGN9_TIGCA|nr:DNA polymerase zeta catalytic subunit-like [Tigriopus californicus]TRY76839.1 hypothetical protein TCAL_14741 [Tigriopus californicus]